MSSLRIKLALMADDTEALIRLRAVYNSLFLQMTGKFNIITCLNDSTDFRAAIEC